MFDSELPRKARMTFASEKEKVTKLLASLHIRYDEPADYTAIIEKESEIIATGSLKGNVIKYVAVDSKHRQEGLTNKIVHHLMQVAAGNGETHLFVYTKPENELIFGDLGFTTIVCIQNEVVLMENKPLGIQNYVRQLKKAALDKEKIAAIVVNCNPFTLGHLYLIETAAKENDWLHIFVLHENRSFFPTQVRIRLVKEGLQHLTNVSVHDSGDYIISAATFPSYFLKEKQDATRIHARLDISIFGQFIAPALGISRRYVGEEPYCQVTNTYNGIMKELLTKFGVEVIEIKRIAACGKAISASYVRECMKNDNYETVKNIVPATTYNFLISPQGQAIAQAIKVSDQRH
jgi:[citrate (pro-3S)-lyase] ligase